MSGSPSYFEGTSEENDEGIRNILLKLQKYVGLALHAYDASDVIIREKKIGESPSPKRMKLVQTSEDECLEKQGILM